jgi:hypothetical protein
MLGCGEVVKKTHYYRRNLRYRRGKLLTDSVPHKGLTHDDFPEGFFSDLTSLRGGRGGWLKRSGTSWSLEPIGAV